MVSDNRAGSALARLVAEGVLSRSQADAVLAALVAERSAAPTRGKVLAEIAAYLGAGLLFGGIFLLMASSWQDLGRVVRVCVLTVVAAGLLLGGVTLAGGLSRSRSGAKGSHSVRTRLAAVLFALASVAVAGAVGTALENGSADLAQVSACLAGSVLAVLGYLAVPSVLGMITCACFVPAAVAGLLTDVFDLDAVWGSVSVLLLGGLWFALTRAGAVVETWAGYLIAIVTSVAAAQSIDGAGRTSAYVLTVLVAVVCFALYATARSVVLVIGGGLSIALAAGQAVSAWTDDALGAAGVVVVIGAIVLTFGAVQLTRSQKKLS
ncbi:DUF2157 domain-containing protein [Nocardia sp. NPDC049220]|uniref:DUF2157 domain-containing protein n=1 Tax=Nocardia sp. NPDC049220 TaxID=3155273 RepID=UPI0033F12343